MPCGAPEFLPWTTKMNAIAQAKMLIADTYEHPDRWMQNCMEARDILELAAANDAADSELLTCLGAVLCDQAHYEEAVAVLQQAAQLGSTDRNTYFNLGVATLNTATHKDAMVYFRRAKKLAALPTSWEAYFDPQSQ
jgi:Tfp pilus assembly protein PilF